MSRYTRYADTDDQEQAIANIEKAAAAAGISIIGGTTIGKRPQTVILDLSHHGGEIRVDAAGEIEIRGENVDASDIEGITDLLRGSPEDALESKSRGMIDNIFQENETAEAPGLKLHALGFRPLTSDDRMGLSGAGERAVLLDVEGNFPMSFVYDLDDQRLELISPDAESVWAGDMTPEQVAQLVSDFKAAEDPEEVIAKLPRFDPDNSFGSPA